MGAVKRGKTTPASLKIQQHIFPLSVAKLTDFSAEPLFIGPY
jgi:hypothetical protein